MIWATRQMPIDDYDEVLDGFSTQWQLLGSPSGMMLLSKREGGTHVRLYVSVTDAKILRAFPGFERIDASEIAKGADLVEGHADEFASRFPEAS